MFNIPLNDVSVRPTQSPGDFRKLLQKTDEEGVYVLQIDNSSTELTTTCMRRALMGLLLGRVQGDKPALTYGSGIHLAMEYFYEYRDFEDRDSLLLGMIEAGQKAFIHDVPLEEWRTPDRLADALAFYVKTNHEDPMTVVWEGASAQIERAFSLPLCQIDVGGKVPLCPKWDNDEPVFSTTDDFYEALVDGHLPGEVPVIKKILVYWTGRLDMLAQQNERTWIVDHKTSSIMGSAFWNNFKISSQMRGYKWAADQIWPDHEIEGVCVNVIVGRRPTRTGTSDEHQRRFFHYPEWSIEEWKRETQTVVSDFIGCLLRGKFPQSTAWCVGKYGTCEYFDVCTVAPALRHLALNTGEFQDNVWSPLHARV